jgi:hypothetical protein
VDENVVEVPQVVIGKVVGEDGFKYAKRSIPKFGNKYPPTINKNP